MQASVKLLPKFKPLSPPPPAELPALPPPLFEPAVSFPAPPLALPAVPLEPATLALPLAPFGLDEDELPQAAAASPNATTANPRPQPLTRIAIPFKSDD